MKVKWHEPYQFILPGLLFVAVFLYYPIVVNIVYSFFRLTPYSSGMRFAGMANYAKLLRDTTFHTALVNNIVLMVVNVIFQVGLALVLALIIEGRFRNRFGTLCRTVFFIPSLFAVTATGILWLFLYEPTVGLLNNLLEMAGLQSWTRAWLGNESSALLSVAAMPQWQYTGYTMMLFVVAIQKVPEDIYEAAEVDGIRGFQKAVYITIPMIKEMILVNLIITVIASFRSFSEVYTLTLGGPGISTQILGLYMYQNAFKLDNMGYASAIGVVVFLITFLFSVVQLRLSRSGEE